MKKQILGIAAALLLSACSNTVAVRESESKFQLFVDVTPKNAVILIDDVAMSTGENTAEIPLKIQAGTRRITIVSDGYYPFKTTLEYIQPGETYTLKTHLIQETF